MYVDFRRTASRRAVLETMFFFDLNTTRRRVMSRKFPLPRFPFPPFYST
jgi:hypothetical protein